MQEGSKLKNALQKKGKDVIKNEKMVAEKQDLGVIGVK